MTTYLVTGGAGFIGANFILKCRKEWDIRVINFDLLTYAGNPENLAGLEDDSGYVFIQGDICDIRLLEQALEKYHPDAVVNFAAESHVDRSILGPETFVHTNINGTFYLLEAAFAYWRAQNPEYFRFLHVSTDEVFGSLSPEGPPFSETTPYRPNSPYSASKAAADHMVRAYHHTYGLATLVTNCSNNYGPRQFPEKLIPLMILNARAGNPLPVYGNGNNIRDWLYVEDHCEAIQTVLAKGVPGESYNVGGGCEKTNNEVVYKLCEVMDTLVPQSSHVPHADLITYVKDRPGHDLRYAIDSSKIQRELGWRPIENFESGILKTIQWYLEHPDWVAAIESGSYRQWIDTNYKAR